MPGLPREVAQFNRKARGNAMPRGDRPPADLLTFIGLRWYYTQHATVFQSQRRAPGPIHDLGARFTSKS